MAVKLKPSDLRLTGSWRTIKEHEKLVRKSLTHVKPTTVVSVCNDVLVSKPGDKTDIKKVSSGDLNEVKNFFAECSAPILILSNRMISGLSATSQVYYSNSDTERLYDFKLKIGGKEVLISNKQLSGGTNTLKPGDVIKIVDEHPELTKAWKNSKQYRVFKILDENLVVTGPMKAVMEVYPTKVPIPKSDFQKVLSKINKNDIDIPAAEVPKSFLTLINKDPFAQAHFKKKRAAAASMLNFIFEKILVDISRMDSDYNDLFVDATTGNVTFFKFSISNTGVIDYQVVDPKKSHKKAVLRSKQGVERRSQSTGQLKLDKLGFQM